jgi:hypothetical protein
MPKTPPDISNPKPDKRASKKLIKNIVNPVVNNIVKVSKVHPNPTTKALKSSQPPTIQVVKLTSKVTEEKVRQGVTGTNQEYNTPINSSTAVITPNPKISSKLNFPRLTKLTNSNTIFSRVAKFSKITKIQTAKIIPTKAFTP